MKRKMSEEFDEIEEEEVEYEYESDDGVDSVVDAAIDVKPIANKRIVDVKSAGVIDLTNGKISC